MKYFRPIFIAAAFLYLAVYIALSLFGGYVESASGGHRLSYGFAIRDSFYWEPYWGSGRVFQNMGGSHVWNSDLVGAIYAPAIYADQRWFHPTIEYMRDDFTINERLIPPKSRLNHRVRSR